MLNVRFWRSPELAKTQFVKDWYGSLGFDPYRSDTIGLAYWRLYFRDRFAGIGSESLSDFCYSAYMDGTFAGRMWFAYDRFHKIGNFGHVYTEPEFRGKGVMHTLFELLLKDLRASDAEIVCCVSGAKLVPFYATGGFKLIYGGESGPLAWIRSGTFAEKLQEFYPEPAPCRVRSGQFSDQFVLDKLLAYAPELMHRPAERKFTTMLWDYRSAFQEFQRGNAVILVSENAQSRPVGYAWALRSGENDSILDFTIHPMYAAEARILVECTVKKFASVFGGVLYAF